MRRKDAVKLWNGRCRKCSAKINNNRPEIVEQRVARRLQTISEWPEEKRQARIEALRQQLARQGGIPNRKPFVKEGEEGRRMAGPSHYAWKGGPEFQIGEGRTSREYSQWRMAVFQRDDFTCQMCGIRGGKLHADHILPWSTYRELRFELSNGRTLCIPCHKTTPTYGWRGVKN
jgi:5-methylcytosine-specific restriction endonuclease McrA